MKIFFVCRSHKKVLGVGDVELDGKSALRHHRISSDSLLLAMSQFMRTHCDCDARWISEKALWDMDLYGYRRVESELGIPFKGPAYMTTEEAVEAREKQSKGPQD